MPATLSDVVQEYVVPAGVTSIRIDLETSDAGRHSSTTVNLEVRPGATVQLRLVCLPMKQPSGDAPPPT